MKKATIGIDPQKEAGIGVILSDSDPFAYHVKDSSIGSVISSQIQELEIEGYSIQVYLEKVSAAPGQGVSSMFKFGDSFGQCKGALDALNVSWRLVTPQTWQKSIIGLPKGKANYSKRKSALNIEAKRRFPKAKPTLKSCDALLIAEYGHRERI